MSSILLTPLKYKKKKDISTFVLNIQMNNDGIFDLHESYGPCRCVTLSHMKETERET